MRPICLLFSLWALVLAAGIELVIDHPVPWYVFGGIAAVATLSLIRFEALKTQRLTVLGVIVIWLTAATLYFVPWSSRKVFPRDLHRISPGMSYEEVLEQMSGYMIGTGWHNPFRDGAELVLPSSIVFRHSDLPTYNSDWGMVRFEDGRVVEVEFLPD